MADERTCTCGHPESEHHLGECLVIRGKGWDFCPCDRFKAVDR